MTPVTRKLAGWGLAEGAVELRSVDQRAAVVNADGVIGGGLGPGAVGDDLILEAAGQGNDAFLGLVGGQERFAFLLVLLGLGLALLLGLLPQLHAVGTHNRLGLGLGDRRRLAGEEGGERLGDDRWVDLVAAPLKVALHVVRQHHADGIAVFLHRVLEPGIQGRGGIRGRSRRGNGDGRGSGVVLRPGRGGQGAQKQKGNRRGLHVFFKFGRPRFIRQLREAKAGSH